MNDLLELQAVVDFALENEKHLDTAVRMFKALPTVRRQIVTAMLDELEKKLADTLGSDWPIYNCKSDVFVTSYPGFKIWGPVWGDDICVNLENRTRESTTIVGVWRAKKPKNTELDDALAQAFAKKGFTGKRQRWWAWYKELPSEDGDWNNAPALIAMHFRRQGIVERLAAEILQVRRVASPIVEAFVRRK